MRLDSARRARALTLPAAALLVAVAAALLVAVAAAPATATTDGGDAISGVVFLDLDADGVADPGEPGIDDVAISIYTDVAVVDATVTDADGAWSVAGLPEGTYGVAVTPPADLEFSEGPDSIVGDDGAVEGIRPGGEVLAGLTSPVGGADLVTDLLAGTPVAGQPLEWEALVANLGGAVARGPVQVRVVLGEGLEAASADGEGWECLATPTVVTCDHPDDVEPGTVLPLLRLTSDVTAAAGSTVSATATATGAVVDTAPLNDEDTATSTVVVADAGGPDGGMAETGTALLPLLAGALLALGLGARGVRRGPGRR